MACNLKYILILFIIQLWLGCGYYSFKGALPSHIKTAAVPLFDNNTEYPNVREEMTNMVVDAFIADNSLTITDESNADLIISGVITSISQRAATVTRGEVVDEYHVTVNIKVKCEDTKNNKVLWEKSLNEFGIMSAASLDEERDAAITVAMEKLTEDILNNTLGYW